MLIRLDLNTVPASWPLALVSVFVFVLFDEKKWIKYRFTHVSKGEYCFCFCESVVLVCGLDHNVKSQRNFLNRLFILFTESDHLSLFLLTMGLKALYMLNRDSASGLYRRSTLLPLFLSSFLPFFLSFISLPLSILLFCYYFSLHCKLIWHFVF